MGIGMLVDYRLSKTEILERVKLESRETISSVIIDLENLLDGVEGSTLFLGKILEQRDYSMEGLEQMLKDIVENNEDIFGSTIALNPELVDNPLGFAPYYFHRQGILSSANLAGERDNYTEKAWYVEAVRAGKPIWVDPYFDYGGGEVLMTTFSVPVLRVNEQGQQYLYAVVTADVALDELHRYLQGLRLGENGFGILLSKAGTVLSARRPESILRHYLERASNDRDRVIWQEIFEAAIAGNTVTRELDCEQIAGKCMIRMDALDTTGWPVGVLYSQREVLKPLWEYQLKTAAVGLLTLLVMFLAVTIIARRLTRPLTSLAHAADEFARGELGSPLPKARGNDEVARLIRSFDSMKKDLSSYIRNLEEVTASRSRLEGELAAAREIQMAMLPQGGEAIETNKDFRLWAKVRPAKTVGGDLYSFYSDERYLCLVVGDVSDKGVPAALFMAKAMSLLQQLRSDLLQPETAMSLLNDALEQGNENCMFVTLFLGVVDLQDYSLTFASAGHTAPSLLRNGMAQAVDQDAGPALALASGLVFCANSLQLLPGDRLAIYTDGIDEAFNTEAEMFGTERFNHELMTSADKSVADAGSDIVDCIDTFAVGTPQSDDITLMLLDIPRDKVQPSVQATRGSRTFNLDGQLTTSSGEWLEHFLKQAGTGPDIIMEMTLVLEELVTNVRKYAELPDDAEVTVKISAGEEAVVLTIVDAGAAFNPLADGQRSTLGADIDSAEIGGLGVHLITQLTDEQSYRREGDKNLLQVVKRLQST